MSAEPRPASPVPPIHCPRCRSVLPSVGTGVHVLRCGGCGAVLEVRSAPPPVSQEPPPLVARPRRRPMVEVAAPQRAQPAPPPPPPGNSPTITVEIITEEPEAEPTPEPHASPEVPWFAEDIEQLPEASVELGQMDLRAFEPLPPLPSSRILKK